MNKSNFLKQLFYYFPGQIYPALINLLLILFLTRQLTIEEYGEYTFLITICGFLVTLFTGWLTQAILYFYPKYLEEGKEDEIKRNIDIFNILLLFIASILTIFFIILSWIYATLDIYIVLIWIVCFQSIYTILLNVFRITFNNKKYLLFIVSSVSLKVSLIIALNVLIELDLFVIMNAILLSYLVIIIKELIIIIKRGSLLFKESKFFFQKDFFKAMFIYGLPILGMGLCSSMIQIIERVNLKYFHSSYELGLYSANMSIVTAALSFIFLPVTMALHPLLMKISAQKETTLGMLSEKISKITTLYFLIGFPIIFFIIVFNNELSILFLGEKYSVASEVIVVGSIGVFLWNVCTIGHKGFEIQKKTTQMFKYIFIASLISALLSIPLIIEFGYIGTAFVSLIVNIIYMIFIIMKSKDIKWNFEKRKIGVLLLICIGSCYVSNYFSGFYLSTIDIFFWKTIFSMFIYLLTFVSCYFVSIYLLTKLTKSLKYF